MLQKESPCTLAALLLFFLHLPLPAIHPYLAYTYVGVPLSLTQRGSTHTLNIPYQPWPIVAAQLQTDAFPKPTSQYQRPSLAPYLLQDTRSRFHDHSCLQATTLVSDRLLLLCLFDLVSICILLESPESHLDGTVPLASPQIAPPRPYSRPDPSSHLVASSHEYFYKEELPAYSTVHLSLPPLSLFLVLQYKSPCQQQHHNCISTRLFPFSFLSFSFRLSSFLFLSFSLGRFPSCFLL